MIITFLHSSAVAATAEEWSGVDKYSTVYCYIMAWVKYIGL